MNCHWSRREFLGASALLAAAAIGSRSLAATSSPPVAPVAVFSKIYQELNFSLEQTVAMSAEAGLDGLDCPVRPGGQIEPERAADELPRLAELLRAKGLSLPLLTTAITSVSTPHAEVLLRAAKKVGVRHYRFGYTRRDPAVDVSRQIAEIRARLEELAALNREVGITGIYQNHSPGGPSGYVGGDVNELARLVEGFKPAEIGAAFDIGHAIVVHGEKWRAQYEAIAPHLQVAYIKDPGRNGGWVPFGQGWIQDSGYFKLLKSLRYQAPYSLHIEFDWSNGGKDKTPAALLAALRSSTRTLRGWMNEA